MFKSLFQLKPNNVRLLSTEVSSAQWTPKKRVSRPTMEKIRDLAATRPEIYNAVTLSKEFKLSVEAIRRILKSKYTPTREDAERQEKNRYEAMGNRRKEFKTHFDSFDKQSKEKEETTPKQVYNRDSSNNSNNRGKSNWSNTTYMRRRPNDQEDQGFRRDQGYRRGNQQDSPTGNYTKKYDSASQRKEFWEGGKRSHVANGRRDSPSSSPSSSFPWDDKEPSERRFRRDSNNKQTNGYRSHEQNRREYQDSRSNFRNNSYNNSGKK